MLVSSISLTLLHPRNNPQPRRNRRLIAGKYAIRKINRKVLKKKAWCERGDSNPHGFTRQILSLVRLPIPPLSRESPTCRDAACHALHSNAGRHGKPPFGDQPAITV